MQLGGLNLLQKYVNIFYQIEQFINTLWNFISLHLEEKSIRYDFFFSRSKHWKLKPHSKNHGTVALCGGDLNPASKG